MRAPGGPPGLGVLLLGLGLLSLGASAPRALEAQPLAPSERATLDAGRALVRTEAVEGSAWPRVTVRRLIASTPEEAAAVFADYDRHVGFIPNLLASRVSRVVDRATAEVDYLLKVPIVADEAYTVRNHVSASGPDSARTISVRWSLVRATSTKAADGEARFEPYGSGTLLTYRTLVTPGGRIAGLGIIRRRALQDVETTVAALGAQVEKQGRSDRATLQAQVARLRAMLAP